MLNSQVGVRGALVKNVADTSLYVLHLQDGGSVVVAGDQRIPAVLVYFEDNSFVPSKLTPEEKQEIAEFFADCLVHNWIFHPNGEFEMGPDDEARRYKGGGWKKEIIKPLIPLNWSQLYPYNSKAPIVKGKQAPVGCVALAVGTLMTVHQYPKSIEGVNLDWSAINRDGDETGNTAYLLRRIGDYLGNEWGKDETGANSKKVPSVLRRLGYSCSNLAPYNEGRIFENLKEGRPMYMRGAEKSYGFLGITFGYSGGHGWVLDGAIRQEQKVYLSVNWGDYQYHSTMHRFYVHCKWGWRGTGDAYFLSQQFNPPRHKFDKRLQVIYDIRPN